MTEEEFQTVLDKFDFYYAYSDDGRVYKAGRAYEDKIDALTKDPVLMDMWKTYCKGMQS